MRIGSQDLCWTTFVQDRERHKFQGVDLTVHRVFLHLHCDLAVMSGWLVLLSARSFLNSLAHELFVLTEHVH